MPLQSERSGSRRTVLNATRSIGVMTLAGFFLVACGDDPHPASGVGPEAAYAPANPPQLIRDDGIVTSDTYLVTDVVTTSVATITYPEPTVDAATGQTVSSITLPEERIETHFEAGYSSDGATRGTVFYDTPVEPGEAARVQIVNDSVTLFAADGSVIADSSGQDLLSLVGSLTNAVVTDSVILTNEMVDSATASGTAAMSGMRSADAASGRTDRRHERVGNDLFRSIETELSADGLERVERIKSFRRSKDRWLLSEERVSSDSRYKGARTQGLVTTEYRRMKFNEHAAKNAVRRARARNTRSAEEASERSYDFALFPQQKPAMAQSMSGAMLAAQTASSSTGGPINVVFQHGIFSDASAWNRMDPWISSRYAIGTKLKPSLPSTQSLESQASMLGNQIIASGAVDFLIIGHSQGGLIGRRAAQTYGGPPGMPIGGVVTFGSAHLGAPIYDVARSSVEQVSISMLQGMIDRVGGSCWRRGMSFICDYFDDAISRMVPRVVENALNDLVPAGRDQSPTRSEFLPALNSRPETFERYSIGSHSGGQFKMMRLLGDILCEPEAGCGGRRIQRRTQQTFNVLTYCSNFLVQQIRGTAGRIIDKCRDLRWDLSRYNAVYETWVSPKDPNSDGIVPGKSQAWPGLNGERHVAITDGDSHLGETRSDRTRERLHAAIDRYQVARP